MDGAFIYIYMILLDTELDTELVHRCLDNRSFLTQQQSGQGNKADNRQQNAITPSTLLFSSLTHKSVTAIQYVIVASDYISLIH